MAATLSDRYALSNHLGFQQRVAAAVLVAANTIGAETAAEQSDRAMRRINLIERALDTPDRVGQWFAHAAAGWNPASPATDIADTYADTAGTPDVKVAAITDAQIQSYVNGAWNVLAGVRPWERT